MGLTSGPSTLHRQGPSAGHSSLGLSNERLPGFVRRFRSQAFSLASVPFHSPLLGESRLLPCPALTDMLKSRAFPYLSRGLQSLRPTQLAFRLVVPCTGSLWPLHVLRATDGRYVTLRRVATRPYLLKRRHPPACPEPYSSASGRSLSQRRAEKAFSPRVCCVAAKPKRRHTQRPLCLDPRPDTALGLRFP